MPHFSILVAGQSYPLRAGGINLNYSLMQAGDARFRVTSETFNPEEGSRVQLFEHETLLWVGYVTEASVQLIAPADTPGAPWPRVVTLDCVDETYLLAKRTVTDSYQNRTGREIIEDLIGGTLGGPAPFGAEGVTAGTLDNGPTLIEAAFNRTGGARVLNLLAEAAGGFVWSVGLGGVLHWHEPDSRPAAWQLTAADTRVAGLRFERANPEYRTRQHVEGAYALTDTVVDVVAGDGETREFGLSWPVGKVPVIEVFRDSTGQWTTQVIGIQGVDSGRHFYWNKGEPTVVQDTSRAIVMPADKVRVTYQGLYPIVARVDRPDLIAHLQNLQDGATSGIVEHVAKVDADMTGSDRAFEHATRLLQVWGRPGRVLRFRTARAGLNVGDLLTVQLPQLTAPGLYLITGIDVEDVRGVWLEYEVTAVQGPVGEAWETWFGKGLGLRTADRIRDNLSSQELLVILAGPTTETVNLAEGWSPTVFACPIAGPGTIAGPTLVVC